LGNRPVRTLLLLNPPARVPVLRDTFCGHFAKGKFYWPPLDLVVLSGTLAAHFDVHVLDAVVSRLSVKSALRALQKLRPDAVVAAVAAATWTEDMAFLAQVKELTSATIVVSGDYSLAQPAQALRDNDFLDAVLLDFASNDLVEFLQGERREGLGNVYTTPDAQVPSPVHEQTFFMPVPRHELFPLHRYHSPQALHHPFALLATDYGCPFRCDFCICERVPHKLRDLSNLREELDYLDGLGVRELRIMDTSFGSLRDHALHVCEGLRRSRRPLSWACEMRVDSADRELLTFMKGSGCHTVMFGVESATDEVLDRHCKGITVAQVECAFRLARETGLRTVAYFIMGLSGETLASQEGIIDFCEALDPDFASFTVAIPTWNTSFRNEIVEQGWLLGEGIESCNPEYLPHWEAPSLPRKKVQELRNRAMRAFYFRPTYIWRQLLGVRTRYQLLSLVREGWHLLISSGLASWRH